jgi:2-dehydropantoate 2-reductase
VSAVSKLKVGPLLADENGRDIVFQVWKEGCEVAKAAGVRDLWPEMEEELPRLAAGFAAYYPSMAQDVLIHQRPTEIALLNGKIAEYGALYGVPTPANTLLTKLVSLHAGKLRQSLQGTAVVSNYSKIKEGENK